jgi:hypothetical protein
MFSKHCIQLRIVSLLVQSVLQYKYYYKHTVSKLLRCEIYVSFIPFCTNRITRTRRMFYHTHVSANFVSDSNINTKKRKCHVRRVACHQCMARPQVAGGGDGLQIWRVAAMTFNKQSRTADREWLCRLLGWAGADNPTL